MARPLPIAAIGLDHPNFSVLGSAGYIELRIYVDIDGRPVRGSRLCGERQPHAAYRCEQGAAEPEGYALEVMRIATRVQRMANGAAASEVRRAAGR